MSGVERLADAFRGARGAGRLALVPFLTAGHPSREGFVDLLLRVGREADAVEVGVPFSDPVADGVTIQRSSRAALRAGVTLAWILDAVRGVAPRLSAPIVVMSYVNPLLAFGLARFARAAEEAGIAGTVVPDLPEEEAAPLAGALGPAGIASIRLVTPATPAARLERLCAASEGCVYAVTVSGTTGGSAGRGASLARAIDRVRDVSPVPVLAGFGIRGRSQMAALRGHADGAVVGSALVERVERGRDPVPFLRSLREAGARGGRTP